MHERRYNTAQQEGIVRRPPLQAGRFDTARRARRVRRALGALVLILTLTLAGCATSIGYLWKQGGYLLRDSLGAQSVQALLKDPSTSSEERSFLLTVLRIKRYAVDEIGLADNANYTKYKKIDRNYLVEVVQAADALSLTAYQWSYPFLGKLPYRGYYVPADAKAEAERLKKEGYDVIVRKVDAFSTLGLLKDPVYSFMERYSLFDLASTIIHEQTHATVFLKGQDQFNEELATFIGDTGALEYLSSTYGPNSTEYRQAVGEQADSRLFLRFVKRLTQALSRVYASPLSRVEKLAKKREVIAEYQGIYRKDYLPHYKTAAYRASADLPLNNAYLMLFNLYTDQIPLLVRFERERCDGSLRVFVEQVKRLSKSPGNMIDKIKREMGMGT